MIGISLSLIHKEIEKRAAAGILGKEFPDTYDAFRKGTVHRLLVDHDPYLAHSFIEVQALDYQCAWVTPVGDADSRIDIRLLEPVDPPPKPLFSMWLSWLWRGGMLR